MINKMKVEGNIYCAGVYYIQTQEGKVLYCGSGQEMNDCLQRHLYYLKRGLYIITNKAILQKEYDNDNLVFKTKLEFDKISDEELGDLEEKHIKLNRATACNAQDKVKRHSSNRSSLTTYKRRKANLGNKNPNNKYDELVICEILWLKMNGYKNKEIAEFYKEVKSTYIPSIGITKWIHLKPIKPKFIEEKEKAASTPIDTASLNSEKAI